MKVEESRIEENGVGRWRRRGRSSRAEVSLRAARCEGLFCGGRWWKSRSGRAPAEMGISDIMWERARKGHWICWAEARSREWECVVEANYRTTSRPEIAVSYSTLLNLYQFGQFPRVNLQI